MDSRFGSKGLNRYIANPIHHLHENSTVRLEDRPHDRPGKPDLVDLVDHTDTTSDLNDQLISEMRKRLLEMQVKMINKNKFDSFLSNFSQLRECSLKLKRV